MLHTKFRKPRSYNGPDFILGCVHGNNTAQDINIFVKTRGDGA